MFESITKRFSSFTYLNVTQFLGALNDNLYKLVAVFFLIGLEGSEASAKILSFTGALFVLPFLLFSASSGTLADRFSKRDIIVFTKIFELVTMSFAVVAFAFLSKFGAYAILFLLATQSAIFSPSKYGIVPEIVETEKISQANGLLTSFTFLAIIFGTFLASFITGITGRNFIIAAIVCTFFAIVGLVTSFLIEWTPPSGSHKKMNPRFLKEIFQTIKETSHVPSLLPAMIGSSFFLFLGGFLQLNIIPYAMQALGLTDVQGGYLFLMTALGIGTGSILAGKISGKIVELGLVPLGGIGVALSCFGLDFFSSYLFPVLFLVVLCGMFGGLYQVPLDSYIQVASPAQNRGQIIAATNFISFFGVLLASGFLYLLSEILHLKADTSFSILGIMTLFVSLGFCVQFFDFLTRFIGMILSKLHFSLAIKGKDLIPTCPAIYVCNHTAWNDTLLLLGSQRRRIHFYIQQEQAHSSKWVTKLYRLLKIVMIPEVEPLEKTEMTLQKFRSSLEKGISVCIFVNNPNIMAEIGKLKESFSFLQVIENTNYPIIPVLIDKGEKVSKTKFFKSWKIRFRVPAVISFGPIIHANQDLIHEPHELTFDYQKTKGETNGST